MQNWWDNWLHTTPALGTYEQRKPEYAVVADALFVMGLSRNDRIVDVGAGLCDLDHYLRTERGWFGRYYPIDASISGVDIDEWSPTFPAEFYVSVETVEHLNDPLRLLAILPEWAMKGVVITTPNPEVKSVIDHSLTHFSEVRPGAFRELGYDVLFATFSGIPNDTTIAVADGYARMTT